jgi:hypothetical protein
MRYEPPRGVRCEQSAHCRPLRRDSMASVMGETGQGRAGHGCRPSLLPYLLCRRRDEAGLEGPAASQAPIRDEGL